MRMILAATLAPKLALVVGNGAERALATAIETGVTCTF